MPAFAFVGCECAGFEDAHRPQPDVDAGAGDLFAHTSHSRNLPHAARADSILKILSARGSTWGEVAICLPFSRESQRCPAHLRSPRFSRERSRYHPLRSCELLGVLSTPSRSPRREGQTLPSPTAQPIAGSLKHPGNRRYSAATCWMHPAPSAARGCPRVRG